MKKVDWSQKKAISFDLGYTLITNKRAHIHYQFLQSKGIELEESDIARTYHLIDKEFMRLFPKVISTGWYQYFPWFVGRVNYELGHCFNLVEQNHFFIQKLEQMKGSIELYWYPFSWTRNTLEELRKRGYKLALLSNWDETARPLLRKLDLDSLFDVIIISDEFGKEKPEPSIFSNMLSQLNCRAEEVVYVGDNYYDDVPGAAEVGIETIILNPYDKLGMEELNYEWIIPDIQQLLVMTPATLEHNHV